MIFGYWCLSNNFGDALAPYILEKMTGERVFFSNSKDSLVKKYLVSGSILNHEIENSITWGCGIANSNDDIGINSSVCGVRGHLSMERYKELYPMRNTSSVAIGDSALILPQIYLPLDFTKKYDVGIIPHYIDADIAYLNNKEAIESGQCNFINLLDPVEKVIDEIVKCRCVVTSSLHGISVAIAYGIPVVWCTFSDRILGDGIKYYDLFSLFVNVDHSVVKKDFSRIPVPANFEHSDFIPIEKPFDYDGLFDSFPAPIKKPELEWEILICTITGREHFLRKLTKELDEQIFTSGLKGKVGYRIMKDSREMTIGSKRNFLKNSSRAKYISFWDDDDFPVKNSISKVYNAIATEPDVVSLIGTITFDLQNPTTFIHSLKYTEYFTKDNVYYRPPNHLNPVKRELVRSIKYPELNHGEDTDWAMRVCRAGILKTEAEVYEPYYFYDYITNK